MSSSQTLTLRTDEELFDESVGYDDETGVRFAPGLTDGEKKQATFLYRLFNELWGVCAVQGDPGTGKDLFGNYLTWKIKRFFTHKKILRDEKPRQLYGEYAGLFNERVIQDDLRKMRAMAKGVKVTEYDEVLEKAADEWVKGAGEVMLKNSVLYLTEYWRYVYNREPHSAMNKTIGAIQKTKRHLDCLVIGTTQLLEELDKRTAKPWVDWVVTCTRSREQNITGFVNFVQRVKYDKRRDEFQFLGKAEVIAFDAGKPRSNMGDGKLHLLKPSYRPQTEEERVVMEVLRSGVDTYEELINIIEPVGDMTENEILTTLKKLSFTPSKRVVSYPCYFRLYNSKSPPQLRSAVRTEE